MTLGGTKHTKTSQILDKMAGFGQNLPAWQKIWSLSVQTRGIETRFSNDLQVGNSWKQLDTTNSSNMAPMAALSPKNSLLVKREEVDLMWQVK